MQRPLKVSRSMQSGRRLSFARANPFTFAIATYQVSLPKIPPHIHTRTEKKNTSLLSHMQMSSAKNRNF